MEVRSLHQDKKTGHLSFLIKGTTASFTNAVRRAAMQEVPTLAIETVEIRKNNSVLYDEMVAHRLGLVPIKTDLKSYDLSTKCKCNNEGCAKCQLKLTLKTKGGNVTSGKLKSTDPKATPTHEGLLIAKLLKGQELEVEATATLGLGKDHMKWSPGHIWFTKQPTVTVNNKSSKLSEMKSKYPPQIFDKKGLIDKNLILEHNLVDACDIICEDIVKVAYNKDAFVVQVEPFGQLPAKTMIVEACNVLDEKLEEFAGLLKE